MMESVKKGFTLSINALKLFYVLAGTYAVINIINLILIPAPANKEMSLGKSLLVIVLTILFALIGVFVYGGVLASVKELIKSGSYNISAFVDNAKKYFLPLLLVSILVLLIFFVVTVLFMVLLGVMPGILKAVFTILMVLAFIALMVLFIFPGYAVIGSDLGAIEAIKKGFLVSKKNFLRVLGLFGIVVLLAIVVMIVASVISGIFSLVLRPLSGAITAIIMAIVNAALMIVVSIIYMDFYLKHESDGAGIVNQAGNQ